MPERERNRAFYTAAILIFTLAGFLRWEAVWKLPVDFDELVYLPMAFRYQEMMAAGEWRRIITFRENLEHPPLNKLLFAADLEARRPKEPNWDALEVGRAIPASDQPAFFGPRTISAIGGTLQVLLTSLVHPVAGLLLALNTYHTKYSAQVYLEGVPGLMAVLAVLLFERAVPPRRENKESTVRIGMLLASAAALGLSAAGKYLYGIAGFVLVAFLLHRARSARTVLTYIGASLLVFLAADPYLWTNPPVRLWETLAFHWQYSHSEHVVSAGMPWYSPFIHPLLSAPTHWHPGVFYTGVADVILLPLAIIGVKRSIAKRPIWAAWAGFGLFVLLLWPTKWPQYILVVLPPLAVCAALGVEQIAAWAPRSLREKFFRNDGILPAPGPPTSP